MPFFPTSVPGGVHHLFISVFRRTGTLLWQSSRPGPNPEQSPACLRPGRPGPDSVPSQRSADLRPAGRWRIYTPDVYKRQVCAPIWMRCFTPDGGLRWSGLGSRGPDRRPIAILGVSTPVSYTHLNWVVDMIFSRPTPWAQASIRSLMASNKMCIRDRSAVREKAPHSRGGACFLPRTRGQRKRIWTLSPMMAQNSARLF